MTISTLFVGVHIVTLVITRMLTKAKPTTMTRTRIPCFLSQTDDLELCAVVVSLSGGAGDDLSTGVPVEVYGVLI